MMSNSDITPDTVKVLDYDTLEKIIRLHRLIMNRGKTYTPGQRRDMENLSNLIIGELCTAPDFYQQLAGYAEVTRHGL